VGTCGARPPNALICLEAFADHTKESEVKARITNNSVNIHENGKNVPNILAPGMEHFFASQRE